MARVKLPGLFMSNTFKDKWVCREELEDKFGGETFDTKEAAATYFFSTHSDEDSGVVSKISKIEDLATKAVEESDAFLLIANTVEELVSDFCAFDRDSILDLNNIDAKKCQQEISDAIRKFLKKNKYDCHLYSNDDDHAISMEDGDIVLEPDDDTDTYVSTYMPAKGKNILSEIWG